MDNNQCTIITVYTRIQEVVTVNNIPKAMPATDCTERVQKGKKDTTDTRYNMLHDGTAIPVVIDIQEAR